MRFNPVAFGLLVLCALLPDLVSILVYQAAIIPTLPYELVRVIKQSAAYPWQGLVFGLTYGIGCYIVLKGISKFGANEIVALMILAAVLRFLLPFGLSFLAPFVGPVAGYLWLISSVTYAVLLAGIVAKGFQVELGISGLLATGFVGLLLPVLDVSLTLGVFRFQWLTYTMLGSVMALWICPTTDWGRPPPDED